MKTMPTLLIALTLVSASAASADAIRVNVNGEPVQFADVQPMMIDGHVMVPLRGVFEQMGADVQWNDARQEVTADRGSKEVHLFVGRTDARVNGQSVHLDTPPVIYQNRVLAPLRFLSETLGADVQWDQNDELVSINTALANSRPSERPTVRMTSLVAGTVIPVRLQTEISSDSARVGDPFQVAVDAGDSRDYDGLPEGAVIEGHVSVARSHTNNRPGVLGLAFDRIRLPDGGTRAIHGSLIGLDDKSVEHRDGRIVAKKASNPDLKYVGYGAGAGVLLSAVTRGNVVNDTVIGAALGYLFGQSRHESDYHDVVLRSGDRFGVRLNDDLRYEQPQ